MKLKFDVARLVADLGGAASIAEIAGVARTTPYRWIESGYLNSRVLERVKERLPALDLNAYFEGRS